MSAPKTKLDPREMMELAIKVMAESVPEARTDAKPSPLVGAVLVRPDGSYTTAARGELREGNHAEFTLIERKCVDEKLDDCILFATLEPCLNRNHPKRGCARHIVSARIKKVYVGIEDDNPTVAGKGIEHLRRHGVTVEMFDLDLQKQIETQNKPFFEWARKQIDKPKDEEPVKLSQYEDPAPEVELNDLSSEALELYHSKLGIGAAFDSADFQRLLLRQGILVKTGEKAVPSGFGLILFGVHPAYVMPQARLLAKAELPDGKSVRMEFDGPLVLIPQKLESWLLQVLPSTVDRKRMVRKEQVDLPFEMIREAVINALIHRDYNIAGQKCQLVVTSDTITIKSPGGPIPPITLNQMQSFSAPMKSRNPILHYVFARLGLAEEQGYGLISFKRRARELRLPPPTYTMEGDYLVLTIYRHTAAAMSVIHPDALKNMSGTERSGWEWLSTAEKITSAEYATALKIPYRTAMNHLKHFQDLELLEKSGSGRATQYMVRRP